MADVDLNLLIPAFLRVARGKQDPAAWLTEIHTAATMAVAGGAEFVNSLSFQGESHQSLQNMPAPRLLALMEACLQRYEAEEADGATQQIGAGPNFAFTHCRV